MQAVGAGSRPRAGVSARRLVSVGVLVMLALPEYGFTRGRARRPGQIQYVACPEFPECPTRPKPAPQGRSRLPRCRTHKTLMTLEVFYNPHG